MKPTAKVPAFFRRPDAMVAAIPETPTSSLDLDPLVDDYLNHYCMDLVGEGTAGLHEFWQSNINHYRIVEQRWTPAGTGGQAHYETLVVVHGYFDHSALYGRFIRWALALGFQVHCFDLPGHGLSSGEPAAIDSFNCYSEILSSIIRREAYPYYHLIGHSTGGAVILNHLLNPRLQPRCELKPCEVVLLAPLVRSMHWQRLRWLYFPLHLVVKSVKRNFVMSSHDSKFFRFQKQGDPLQATRIPMNWLGAMEHWVNDIKQLPVNEHHRPLIIQGTQDATVDWEYNFKEIQRCLPKTQYQLINNAWHNLVNESEAYWLPVKQAMESLLCSEQTTKVMVDSG